MTKGGFPWKPRKPSASLHEHVWQLEYHALPNLYGLCTMCNAKLLHVVCLILVELLVCYCCNSAITDLVINYYLLYGAVGCPVFRDI